MKIRPLFFSLAVTALFAFGAPALFGQAQNASPKPKPQAQPQVQPKNPTQVQPQIQPKTQVQSPAAIQKPSAMPRVQFTTNLGAFTLELNSDAAPKTVENFLNYVKSGFYKETAFHRVISTFMVQGGGFTADGAEKKKTNSPVVNEAKAALEMGLSNVRGSIAMARTPDPDSATSQFFINVVDNPFLDYPGKDGAGYCVFGQVVEGMDTIDKIRDVKIRPGGPDDNWPMEPVIITDAKIIAKKTSARSATVKPAAEKPAPKNAPTKPAADKPAPKNAPAKPAADKPALKNAPAKPAADKPAPKSVAK